MRYKRNIYRLLVLFFPFVVVAQANHVNSCESAFSFDSISRDRLRNEVGRGAIGEQVKRAIDGLRLLKNTYPGILQSDLVEQWQDYVSVLEEVPTFKSHKLHINTDVLFVGKRDNEYYFLSITREVPAHLYYGVRKTKLDSKTDWKVGNFRFEEL